MSTILDKAIGQVDYIASREYLGWDVFIQALSSECSNYDLPIPDPMTAEVLIRVEAAGICHSDTHVLKLPVHRICQLPVD